MKQANKQTGGYARAASLSPERRSEIARNAVLKRWAIAGGKAGNVPASIEVQTNRSIHNEDEENAVQAFQNATTTNDQEAH